MLYLVVVVIVLYHLVCRRQIWVFQFNIINFSFEIIATWTVELILYSITIINFYSYTVHVKTVFVTI